MGILPRREFVAGIQSRQSSSSQVVISSSSRCSGPGLGGQHLAADKKSLVDRSPRVGSEKVAQAEVNMLEVSETSDKRSLSGKSAGTRRRQPRSLGDIAN